VGWRGGEVRGRVSLFICQVTRMNSNTAMQQCSTSTCSALISDVAMRSVTATAEDGKAKHFMSISSFTCVCVCVCDDVCVCVCVCV
jgi:hypothetical protein